MFTKFAKGYREFELNKALALPTGYSLRFYMLMSGQVYPLDISLDNLKERLGIPADKYKDKNGKDRIDNFEERVLKPAKAALDESCPYTFNYVKVRENPNNKRSKVTGFRFYPVYQPQFRDEELEVKELQAKVTARHQIDSHVYEYLRYSCGFTSEEINRNKETFITAQENITDLIRELAILNGKSTYEDDEEWWKCGFISNPKYKKHTGIITFRVSNDLWDVFTKFAKGYREFELNKALALPTGYSLRFYMLMSGQVYPLDISLDNLKERLGIPADKYKDKNGKDRIDNFEERVLKPAKAALDESCPYTFNYVKVRENPNNKRSKVTGFRFYPVYQPQFRDEELEVKELQAKVTARHQIDSHVYEYLRYSCGFTSE
ncbi:replication initiation protein, partial [Bacteroides thetaiotaomicron]